MIILGGKLVFINNLFNCKVDNGVCLVVFMINVLFIVNVGVSFYVCINRGKF